ITIPGQRRTDLDLPEADAMTDKNKAALPFHPFLFAAFPVLFLYARNARYAVTWRDALVPLVVVLAGTGLVLLLAWLSLGRRLPAAALVTSILVVLFFSYGPVYQAIVGPSAAGARLARH